VQYEEMYNRSIQDPNGFWSDMAKEFHWEKQWDEQHINWNFDVRKGPISVEWFKGGTTNICYNALDRHVAAGAVARGGQWFGGGEVCLCFCLTLRPDLCGAGQRGVVQGRDHQYLL
jgi:acetyl-CoA synthetase